MQEAPYPISKSELLGRLEAVDLGEQKRRVGRVYRLILNYEPRTTPVVTDEIGGKAPQMSQTQSTDWQEEGRS